MRGGASNILGPDLSNYGGGGNSAILTNTGKNISEGEKINIDNGFANTRSPRGTTV
jgi:hypothetical protein